MKHRMGLFGWTHSGMVFLALLALLAECAAVGPPGSTIVIDNEPDEEDIDSAGCSGVVGLGSNDGDGGSDGLSGAVGTNGQQTGPGSALWSMQLPWRIANMNVLTEAQQQHLAEAIHETSEITGELPRYHPVWVRWIEEDSSVTYYPAYIDSCHHSQNWEYMVMWLSHHQTSRVNAEELLHRTSNVRYDNWSVNQYMLETARSNAASTGASTARISRHVCHAQGVFLTEGSESVGIAAASARASARVARGSGGGASAGPNSNANSLAHTKKRARESNSDSKTDSRIALHDLAAGEGVAQHGNAQRAPASLDTPVSTGAPEDPSSLTELLKTLSAQNIVILARIQACEEATNAAIAAATQATAVATAIITTAAAAVTASTEATAAATTATAEVNAALGSMTAVMNGLGMVRGAVAQSNATEVAIAMHEDLASTHTQPDGGIQIGLDARQFDPNFPVQLPESSGRHHDNGGASK